MADCPVFYGLRLGVLGGRRVFALEGVTPTQVMKFLKHKDIRDAMKTIITKGLAEEKGNNHNR